MLAAVVSVFDAPPRRVPEPLPGPGPEAFVGVVRTVVAAVLHLAPDHPDVDDGVSETMRRALEGRVRLRPGEPMRPWVLGIARHVAVDTIRRRVRERPAAVPTAPDSAGDVSIFDRIPDSAPSPHDQLERERSLGMVRDAMKGLPEGMREALTLFYVEGLGYEAIAAKMNIPLGTVATWIARGRKTLSERMRP